MEQNLINLDGFYIFVKSEVRTHISIYFLCQTIQDDLNRGENTKLVSQIFKNLTRIDRIHQGWFRYSMKLSAQKASEVGTAVAADTAASAADTAAVGSPVSGIGCTVDVRMRNMPMLPILKTEKKMVKNEVFLEKNVE